MATVMALVLGAALTLGAPTPDPQPTTQPTAPATTATAGASRALAQHIPDDLRSSCEPTSDALPAGATAQLDCTFDKSEVPDTAFYIQFSDADSMKAFTTKMSGSEPLGNDACKSVTDLEDGGTAPYSVDNEPRGTVWCYRNDDKSAVLMWSDDDLNIAVVSIESSDSDFEKFLDWYTTAGPVS